MDDLDSLLYPLFDYLRRAAIPIGVGDYLLALKTVRAGQGIESLEQLRFTCKLLWAKSQEDQEIVNQAFTRLVASRLRLEEQAPKLQLLSDLPQRLRIDELINDVNNVNSSSNNRKIGREAQGNVQEEKIPLNANESSETANESPKAQGAYQLTPRLPISKREMTGIWRHLRQMGRSGLKTELDIDSTLSAICRDGFLHQPVLRPRRQNQTHLLILVDRQGSMSPFIWLIDAMLESIQRSGLADRTQVYYFYNCPEGYLASHPGLIQYSAIDTVLATHSSSILIVSDAGAARGAYRRTRVEQTQAFLATLRQHTYLIAWLNPLPSDRWRSNTAGHIAELVPMFPLNRYGMIDAVNVLLGRPVDTGVSSYG